MLTIFLGAPGTGKGTLASELKNNHNFIHISTGDLMREEIKTNSILGQELQARISSGNLVDDELTNKILRSKLSTFNLNKDKIILDGYPRSIPQVQYLTNFLKEKNHPVDKVILFELDNKILLERLTGRRICKQCGAIFHIKTMKPKKENVCDLCGGLLFQRPDDEESKISVRLETYLKTTKPLIDFYKKENLLSIINVNDKLENLVPLVLKKLNQ